MKRFKITTTNYHDDESRRIQLSSLLATVDETHSRATAPTERAMEYYEIASLLGSGSFAKVYLARDTRRPQSRVALKLIDVERCRRKAAEGNADGDGESSDATALLRREADVHATVSAARHPNIVGLLESFRYVDNAGAEVVALAMEHCPRGDMQQYMNIF